jgi:glycosyltransferase involved in cell wall biosynthesis
MWSHNYRMSNQTDKLRIALFLSSMEGGGVERLMLNLAHGFQEKELDVEIVLAKAYGHRLLDVPKGCTIIDLGVRWGKGDKRIALSLPALTNYLSQTRPHVLIAAPGYSGVIALLARWLARTRTAVIVIIDSALSPFLSGRWHERFYVYLVRHWFRHASAIIASSHYVAKQLIELARIPSERVTAVYNPVVTAEIFEAAKDPPDHPWFQGDDIPMVLAIGRLVKEKDFSLLIRAFEIVRNTRYAKLVILGEGNERLRLEKLVQELRLSEDVALLGYKRNPYSYIARASVLVLSSSREALSNVLIEAMALGTPVVATNTLSGGPAEILRNGEYGKLVKVGDEQELAKAINETLETSADLDRLRKRSMDFNVENAIAGYLEVIDRATK